MEKRNRRLSTIVNDIYLVHIQRPVSPIFLNVRSSEINRNEREDQKELFDYLVDWRKKELGYFYDMLTAGMYGGELKREITLAEEWVNDFDYQKVKKKIVCYPDIFNENEEIFYEVKACHVPERLKLSYRQMTLYKKMKELYPYSQLNHVIFRHNFENLSLFNGLKEELYKELSSKTLCALILPFSITNRLFELDNNEISYEYDGPFFQKGKEIRSRFINRFFFESSKKEFENIAQILSLNPDNYEIERNMSPLSISIEGNKVKQFPILNVKEKDNNIKQDNEYIPF